MTHDQATRRAFLALSGAVAASSGAVARALAAPVVKGAGSLQDLEHVVVFMQENRSFDHYFGALRGVRGFSDPAALALPGGASVFDQPRRRGGDPVRPFRFDGARSSAESLHSLDHSWKGSHQRWRWHDAWVQAKSELTMGYFTREDLPFYYALADAFTICDGYHCSIFGPTNPNRLFLFTGTSGLAVGQAGPHVVANPPDETNETADPGNDAADYSALTWTTYAERLEAAGVSWKVYQEYDNYGDNPLAYFARFRAHPLSDPLVAKARSWAAGSNRANARPSTGDALVSAFAQDVAADALPSVSWIVAPYSLCEHPSATPGAGEHLTARLIDALTANPAVWSKTAFILTYDENDGFFDHALIPTPPAGSAPGASAARLDGEIYRGEPVGLGPRVPTIVVSPWTKGGWVNSQTFDHTSVLRLLEARFGVAEPNITPWRRLVTGDLTSVFDFAASGPAPALPDARALPLWAAARSALPAPRPPPGPGTRPGQEPGDRPSRALPYDLEIDVTRTDATLETSIVNRGAAGAWLTAHPADRDAGGPWQFAAAPGQTLRHAIAVAGPVHDLTFRGPNGFLRRFRGRPNGPLACRLEPQDRSLAALRLTNTSSGRITVRITDDFAPQSERTFALAPGESRSEMFDLTSTARWYDLTLVVEEAPDVLLRLSGRIETGAPGRSDPRLGRPAV